jgi:regulator of sirC expression with transglutaminase-like and TPR domain
MEPRTQSDPLPVDAAPARAVGRQARIEALVALLDDPSPTVWNAVRRELERLGQGALPALRKVEAGGDPRVRTRARSLLTRFERERVARRMIGFAMHGELDLERGLLLLSRFEEPELDLRGCVLALDAMAAEVIRRIDDRAPRVERIQVLLDYLARELGYTGDAGDYHHPDNVYLHRAIERRRGLPLTLVAIFVLVARRAGLRAAPVALPGHVVLRLYENERGQLFDPFHASKPLSDRDCLQYLAEHGLPFHPRWFDDTSDATLWTRHVRNLANSYRRRGLEREVELLEIVIAVREQIAGNARPAG